ncbi:pyrrolysine--tRNA(Pyl) ligase small subunit [Phosphitispora fastidiosa]|uniref:pyrrolysine--tRNA(Pyl) ligase small subunit n=1 Tax=Phosphitispora fastidiosa TaxID=2837202 RepID=UPI001E429115|nr:pyrrolysine--tRNA(Pyl) ligase small subunit [Phosphitispora fastidiosa]MBU7006085.1 pyrrolysyl-tRNA synthetase-like protein [Phosphitispora fastidiosa]
MSLPVQKTEASSPKKAKKRYFRKHEDLAGVIEKIKLWPSRSGVLHGVRKITVKGRHIEIVTHCGNQLDIKNSKTSRVSRWLRNKWYAKACPKCKIPTWKLEKFSSTSFQ